jgi:hypothetical protein
MYEPGKPICFFPRLQVDSASDILVYTYPVLLISFQNPGTDICKHASDIHYMGAGIYPVWIPYSLLPDTEISSERKILSVWIDPSLLGNRRILFELPLPHSGFVSIC